MSVHSTISILRNNRTIFTRELESPLAVGRQDPSMNEPAPGPDGVPIYLPGSGTNPNRLVITHALDTGISRSALYFEPRDKDLVIENRSSKGQAFQTSQGILGAGQQMVVLNVVTITLDGDLRILAGGDQEEDADLHTLRQSTLPPDSHRSLREDIVDAASRNLRDETSLMDWLKTTIDVLEGAMKGEDVYQRAIDAALSLVRLGSAQILLWESGNWNVHCTAKGSRGGRAVVSQRLLGRMLRDKRTVWKQPGASSSLMGSLKELDTAIASPILDSAGEIIGALYGHRMARSADEFIREEDGKLLELLARLVATGLASRDLMRLRVRFDQFFTHDLSQKLLDDQGMLAGRVSDVTVMFCDIRKFSSISTRLGPDDLGCWLRNVMDVLSDKIMEHSGVVVDYIGDEVMAMWGAPEAQPDHAELACRAALDMLRCLPALNQAWEATLGEPFSFGIGIHSGTAQVGNTGSNHRFKYGPLGKSVNLASRIQGVTKQLRSPVLLTADTKRALPSHLVTRRLGKVRVMNISEPVELYELSHDQPPSLAWMTMAKCYEDALGHFEAHRFREALDQLLRVLQTNPQDGPALSLIERAVPNLLEPSLAFDPVWDMKSK